MTAPSRVVRQSPSGRKLGALGFARLSLKTPAAYVAGVALQIPFDTIDVMSDGFGSLVTGGLGAAPGAFRLTDTGLYLVTTTLTILTAGTAFEVEIISGGSLAAFSEAGPNIGVSAAGNALVTDLTGISADIASAILVTGASDNVHSATCLIVQVN